MALFLMNVPEVESKTLCEQCGDADAPKQCTACKSVRYCNEGCQSTNWDRHRDQCAEIKHRTGKKFYAEPSAELLVAEKSTISYREAVQRCGGFTVKAKMVLVFWTPRSPYGQYFFSKGLDKEPAHNNQRVHIFTLSEFARQGFFEHNKSVRNVVRKILKLQRAEGVWAAVVCMDDGCIGVKGGIYEPK